MKKFILAIMFGLLSLTAFAEATFDQIQVLIEQRQYQAAEQGLEVIIKNHPNSAKAFYAMAQAQAGLGNQEKAKRALDLATGLNPTLDFAPASSVASLKEAITPQVKKIEAIEETHYLRNFVLFAMFAGFGVAMYFLYSVYARKKDKEEALEQAERHAEYARTEEKVRKMQADRKAEEAKHRAEEEAAEAALRAHKNYGKAGFNPANPDKLKTKAQLKKEADEAALIEAEREARMQRLRAEAAEEDARRSRMTYSSAPATTVVHTGNGSNDMLTGVLIGNMLSSHHDHSSHDTTIIRETVREVPASPSSTWDDTPAPSKSSSWDSTPSKSSSWDDSSSSSSSSSWSSSSSDSGSSWSSSSDSGSSSSWD